MNDLIVGNNLIELDVNGHLLDYALWNTDIALALAQAENLSLAPTHWEIIQVARDFYTEFQHIPKMRIFVKHLKDQLGSERGNSQYIYQFFPAGLRQLCRIAGLPKPRHCI